VSLQFDADQLRLLSGNIANRNYAISFRRSRLLLLTLMLAKWLEMQLFILNVLLNILQSLHPLLNVFPAQPA